jgi:GAF domain-containing protein
MRKLVEEDRLRQLIAVGPVLVSELDLDTLLARLLETACQVTAARYAAIGVLNAERRELDRFITHGLTEEQEQAIGAPPRGRGVLGLVIEDPRPLRLTNVGTHPKSFGYPPSHPPMHSFLGVPIVIRGEAWGNLYLTEKRIGDFSDEDEYAATTLAAWAAIAIDHTRLLSGADERQVRLAAAVRRLEATQAVAVAIGAESDLGRVLDLIAERGRAIVEARSLLILLREEADLVVTAQDGEGQAQAGGRVPVADGSWGQVMLAKRPVRSDDPSQLGDLPGRLGLQDVRSALLAPLLYGGEALGVMAAFDRSGGSAGFDEDDAQVLAAFAVNAATAVQQRGQRERTR